MRCISMADMKQLALVLLIFATPFVFAGEGGVSGGGGGTSVVYQGQRVFLDLLMLPHLREAAIKHDKQYGDPQVAAKTILDRWNEKRLSISSVQAESAFQGEITWREVNEELPLSTRYFVPADIEVGSPKTVAYYKEDGTNFDITVSIPGLGELSSLGQLAVNVHESLRHLQIGWDKENNAFDEKALQEATAIYVLCEPSNTLGMYVNFILVNKREEAEKLYGDSQALIEKHCRRSL